MTSAGVNLNPARVNERRRRAWWLIKRGWTGVEIARELRVSPRTVERYRARWRRKASG